MVQFLTGVVEIGALLEAAPGAADDTPGTRLFLEHLDDRVVLSNYSAANVAVLIADITASNTAGGSNTITLTAPTTSPMS